MNSKERDITSNKGDSLTNERFIDLLNNCPIPDNELANHLGLFIKRQAMSRVIFMYELYKKIIGVHGVVFEFGVRWGQDIALFESFRGMLEPFNYNRKLVGFDTFAGFPSVSDMDKLTHKGDMNVTENYETYLEKVLSNHEGASPLSHIKKYELIKGDATVTFKEYLNRHPETIIAFAYFDFDIYEPTKLCLESCRDRFTKGSIIGFDELNHPDWPGETVALREILGIDKVRVERMPFMPTGSYIVVE